MEEKNPIFKNLGFQYSIRKTFPVSVDRFWEFLLSEQGIFVWLGGN